MTLLMGLLLSFSLAVGAEPGFEELFDGKSLNGWSLLGRQAPSGSWQVLDGALVVEGRPGYLATVGEYSDFDLRLEWRVGAQGNSGVFYRFQGTRNPATVAIEYQIADNARPASQRDSNRKAGAAYRLYAPEVDVAAPPEEWNSMRIVALGSRVEHWLNGQKVAEFDCSSKEFRDRASAFDKGPDFGAARSGRIVLQDHGESVAFRNIQIRRLD